MSTGSRNGGMGMRKHGRSGKTPKSPKLRHQLKREAESNELKADKPKCHAKSMRELLS